MSQLQLVILVCLLLAAGATTASCLIPELTIVAGIWGIPVLGFALLVGAIFRVAEHYDPRVEQSPNGRRHAAYVAGGLLCNLIAFSSLEIIFTKGQHIAVIVCSTLGVLIILGGLTFGEYIWVINQTADRGFPSMFELKRFLFVNGSGLYVISCLFAMENLRNVLKPMVIFFAYANCISFAAVYSGIYRETILVASNGTIRERLATWIRSKMQPGKLFSSVQSILTVLFFIILIIQRLSEMPSKYNPIGKGLFLSIAAVSFYTATLYDPRKPPETSKVKERVVGVVSFLSFATYIDWNVQNIPRYSDVYHDHYLAVNILNFVTYLLVIGWYLFETSDIVLEMRKILSFLFQLAVYHVNIHVYIYMTAQEPDSQWRIVALTICNVFYYLVVLRIVAIIAGINREVARQVSPVQVPPVQVPLAIVVEQPPQVEDLERPPPVEDLEES
jgi:hypothetical protein